MRRIIFILIAAVVVSQSCLNVDPQPQVDVEDMTIENAIVPDDFDYSTTKDIVVSLTVPARLNRAVFSLIAYRKGVDSLNFARATFDENGFFESTYTIPVYIDTVLVKSEFLGFIEETYVPVYGTKADYDYRSLYNEANLSSKSAVKLLSTKSTSADGFSFMGGYDSRGVPDYLVANDPIQQNLIDDVNATLPEYRKIPLTNPEYLASGVETNLVLKKQADVWVTFVAEGAGYRNVLGYYTYKEGEEPGSAEDIEDLKIIFPNVSHFGSDGGLFEGNRVYLGTFPQGTVIGWFLIANGFQGTNITDGYGIRYSNAELNSERDTENKGHMVALWDKSREHFLLGFEDMGRNPENRSDEDFNDAVFYATTNPVNAVDTDDYEEIEAANDSDGDGINDELDDFPYDPNKSFNNFAPSNNEIGTVAYEDLWPSKGDYDFNDLVVNYQINTIADATNKISSIEADFTIQHIGAAFSNGFAIILPVTPNAISGIENQVKNGGYVSYNTNGTEAGQNESVIFVAEDVSGMTDETIKMVINFKNPVEKSVLGTPPYNPFIVVDGEREREVHLPDMAPTPKGEKYLGQNDDFSDPSNDRYFKTNRNLPWAINLYSAYTVPPEKMPIDKVYPKFISWANSGGTKDTDWYK